MLIKAMMLTFDTPSLIIFCQYSSGSSSVPCALRSVGAAHTPTSHSPDGNTSLELRAEGLEAVSSVLFLVRVILKTAYRSKRHDGPPKLL